MTQMLKIFSIMNWGEGKAYQLSLPEEHNSQPGAWLIERVSENRMYDLELGEPFIHPFSMCIEHFQCSMTVQ